MRRDDLDPLRHLNGFCRNDESRKAARALAFASPCEGHVEVRDPAVGDVGLLANQFPLIAVAKRGGLHVGGVRTTVRLGHREGCNRLPACDPRKPFALLLDRSEQRNRARSKALHGKGKSARPEW